jgi:uncharacterized protein YrrD
MKKILILLLICLPLFFITCKKEKTEIEIESSDITINKAWELTLYNTYITYGDQYQNGVYIDSLTGLMYTGKINYVSSAAIMINKDTIFPSLSASYFSRVWSISENNIIIDTYYDDNGFPFNISQHNYTINLDTLSVNFQSGTVSKFVINELTSEQFHVISEPTENYIPIFNVNGIYQDTVMMNLTSDNLMFSEVR